MTNVLIVNQHGDNRGDEAAMRAMVNGLAERIDNLHVTIIHQFTDPASEVELGVPHRYLPIWQPISDALRFGVAGVLAGLGLRADALAAAIGREKIEAFRQADLVISAPGGPYFGDLYVNHEIVHWFYVWIAHRLGKPLFLYAPSCGPFEHRTMNMVRRRGYRWFDKLTLREATSAKYLHDAFGLEAEVTADSALQELVPHPEESTDEESSRSVAVSVRDPGGDLTEQHDHTIVEALRHLAAATPSRFTLLPQLHGKRHSDAAYLHRLVERAGLADTASVLDDRLDSNAQRQAIASADVVIAGRYHPLIFSISAGVPVLAIPYEHKARASAIAAGLDDFILELEDMNADLMCEQLDRLVQRSTEVRSTLSKTGPLLQQASARTSELAAQLVPATNGGI